jgi:hypothetical protein
MRALIAFLLTVLCLCMPCYADQSDDEARAINAAIIQQRLEIKSPHLLISMRTRSRLVSPWVDSEWEFWSQGEYFRLDRTVSGTRHVVCWEPDYFLEWHSNSQQLKVELANSERLKTNLWTRRTDPRLCMLVPSSLYYATRETWLTSNILGSRRMKNAVIADVMWEGLPAKDVNFEMAWNAPDEKGTFASCSVSYTVVPSRDYNIVRCLNSAGWKRPGDKEPSYYRVRMTCTLQSTGNGHYFPADVEHFEASAPTPDAQEQLMEKFTIKVVSLYTPLDPECFSPRSFGLPVGTPMISGPGVNPTQNTLWWDGKEMTAPTYDQIAKKMIEADQRAWDREHIVSGKPLSAVAARHWRLWPGITALVLAILAVALCLISRRKRTQSPE